MISYCEIHSGALENKQMKFNDFKFSSLTQKHYCPVGYKI
jgi:hypothetical protein